MPSFPKGLTLNTIISILATGSKSALLCMIGTLMGQLKWIWFQGEERSLLHDLQSLDDVSRGPWGSMMLLLRPHKGRFLLSLGATITIFALAFDPFLQQILTFPVRHVANDSSTAAVQQAVVPQIPLVEGAGIPLSNSFHAGMYSEHFDVTPICPSGNCTWPSFQSVGWCSKCEDFTSIATLVGCDIASFNTSSHDNQTVPCNITLANGLWVRNDITGYWSSDLSSSPFVEGFMMDFTQNRVANLNDNSFAYFNQSILGVTSPLRAIAHVRLTVPTYNTTSQFQRNLNLISTMGCVLSPCVRTYNVSVSKGITTTQTSTPEFGEIFSTDGYGQILHHKDACWKPKQGSPVDFTVDEDHWPPKPGLLQGSANFAVCPIEQGSVKLISRRDIRFFYNTTTQVWESLVYKGLTLATESIETFGFDGMMANIAASLTKYAREISNQTVQGTAYVPEVYISVNWAFLTLPGVLIVLGIVFLSSTIMVNRKHDLELWKLSILPLVYHGVTEDVDGDGQTAVSSMEHMAQEVNVKLEVSGTKQRLTVQD